MSDKYQAFTSSAIGKFLATNLGLPQPTRLERYAPGDPLVKGTVVVGGTHDGLFYRPTVLSDVTTAAAAWTDEVFGPVAPVVAFDDDDEALALANDSEYGLAGAVYSRSVSRGLALAQRIRSGMVHVNDQTVNDEAVIPFGGMGASGNGSRFGGPANQDEFTQWQWVTVRDEPRSFPHPY